MKPETKQNLPLLTILVGIQGSGKSTWAKQQPCVVLSSDGLRQKFPTYNNDEIFKELYKLANEFLEKDLNVIIDSTAITIKSRRKIFESIKIPCIKKALIFNTPFEICKERLIERNKQENSHKVPLEVQRKYLESFEVPFLEEGFDYIDIYNKPTKEESDKNILDIYEKTIGFNQNNKHHTQTLDKHLQSTCNYLKDNVDIALLQASLYHDIGKLFTQKYKEGDTNAHYYNHANVGAYWFLCNGGILSEGFEGYRYLEGETLDCVFYINYHMKLYDLGTQKSKDKWGKIFGEEKFRNLRLLHEADMNSH